MLFNTFFTVISGSLLHFAFNFFNRSLLAGLFSAVNESVWEHLKLAVMPMAFLGLWRGIRSERKPNNFWLSRAKAIYLAPIIIIILFYGYTAICGRNYLILDIAAFVIAVIIAEFVAEKITLFRLNFGKRARLIENLSKFMIVFIVSLFMYFTFYPPRSFLFLDPTTGKYGIQPESLCASGDCEEGISLPKGYTFESYSVEKVLDNLCVKNSDCETPGEYLIQSRCPFVSICLKNKCNVVCPGHQKSP